MSETYEKIHAVFTGPLFGQVIQALLDVVFSEQMRGADVVLEMPIASPNGAIIATLEGELCLRLVHPAEDEDAPSATGDITWKN